MDKYRLTTLANAEQVQDDTNGRMTWQITDLRRFIAEYEILGIAAQNLTSVGGSSQVSREKIGILKSDYKRQKWILGINDQGEEQLYEFVTNQQYIANGIRDGDKLWLVLREVTNEKVVTAIKAAIGGG